MAVYHLYRNLEVSDGRWMVVAGGSPWPRPWPKQRKTEQSKTQSVKGNQIKTKQYQIQNDSENKKWKLCKKIIPTEDFGTCTKCNGNERMKRLISEKRCMVLSNGKFCSKDSKENLYIPYEFSSWECILYVIVVPTQTFLYPDIFHSIYKYYYIVYICFQKWGEINRKVRDLMMMNLMW